MRSGSSVQHFVSCCEQAAFSFLPGTHKMELIIATYHPDSPPLLSLLTGETLKKRLSIQWVEQPTPGVATLCVGGCVGIASDTDMPGKRCSKETSWLPSFCVVLVTWCMGKTLKKSLWYVLFFSFSSLLCWLTKAQIDDWISRCDVVIPDTEYDVMQFLLDINHHLKFRTFLVGYSLTLADCALWSVLKSKWVSSTHWHDLDLQTINETVNKFKKAQLPYFARWWDYLKSLPEFQFTSQFLTKVA